MAVSIEVRTTSYGDNAIHVKKAMANIASLCEDLAGYHIGEPSSKFGWTFYTVQMNDDLFGRIMEKFQDMIQKCHGRGNDDKFIAFMTRYFEARGAKVNVKLLKV